MYNSIVCKDKISTHYNPHYTNIYRHSLELVSAVGLVPR